MWGSSIDSLVIREKKKEEGGRSEQLPSCEVLGHIKGPMRHINKPQCTNPNRHHLPHQSVFVLLMNDNQVRDSRVMYSGVIYYRKKPWIKQIFFFRAI